MSDKSTQSDPDSKPWYHTVRWRHEVRPSKMIHIKSDCGRTICCTSGAYTKDGFAINLKHATFVSSAPETATERDIYKNALETIAGVRDCPDKLMGNADIARSAIKRGRAANGHSS